MTCSKNLPDPPPSPWVRRMVNVGLVAASTLLTLVFLEVCVRALAPQPIDLYNFARLNEEGMVVKEPGVTYGTRYRVNIKPPGEGPMRPNQRLRKGNVDFVVNEDGWRDRSYPRNAARGTYRLLVVGDSVTFGYGVELEETYHKRLEDRLNQAGGDVERHFEVIALAGAGATTYDALRNVRHHIGYFRPQELWLAFNLNDILFQPYEVPGSDRDHDQPLPTVVAHGDASVPLQVRLTMLLGWLRDKVDGALRPRSHLYHLVRQRTKVLLRRMGIYSPFMQSEAAFAFSSSQAAWAATLAAIIEIRKEALRHGARFAVMVLPTDPQTSADTAALYRADFQFRFDDDYAQGIVQKRICSDLAAQGIECLDPLPLFRAHPDQQLFLRVFGDSVDWNHPNAAGHSLLAEALFTAVESRLLPKR